MKGVATAPDGVSIHYETQGAGNPALVLVHGWCCDRTYWAAQAPYFAQTHQVVTVDLGGHGESGPGRKDWTMPAFGSDVKAVVEKLELSQVVLVGHSMGGPVVAEAARQMPQRVIGLVGTDTFRNLAVTFTSQDIAKLLAPFRNDFTASARRYVPDMFIPASDSQQKEWIIQDMAAAPPEVGISAMENNRRYRDQLRTTLSNLRMPKLAINSDYRPNDLETAAACGLKIVLMSGVGHFVMLEDPATFNRLLEEAMGQFTSAGSSAVAARRNQHAN